MLILFKYMNVQLPLYGNLSLITKNMNKNQANRCTNNLYRRKIRQKQIWNLQLYYNKNVFKLLNNLTKNLLF